MAFSTSSGPIPAGSPTVSAMRGRRRMGAAAYSGRPPQVGEALVANLRLARQLALGQLVPEAALEAAAQPRQLRRVEAQVLLLGHLDRHRLERLEPRAAAQRPTARPVPAEHARLVADADLPHLDPAAELRRQFAHELPEIDPPFRREVEHQAGAVVQLLDARQLHGQRALADLQQADAERLALARLLATADRAVLLGRDPEHARAVSAGATPFLLAIGQEVPTTRPNATPTSVSTRTGTPGRSGFWTRSPCDDTGVGPPAATELDQNDRVVLLRIHVACGLRLRPQLEAHRSTPHDAVSGPGPGSINVTVHREPRRHQLRAGVSSGAPPPPGPPPRTRAAARPAPNASLTCSRSAARSPFASWSAPPPCDTSARSRSSEASIVMRTASSSRSPADDGLPAASPAAACSRSLGDEVAAAAVRSAAMAAARRVAVRPRAGLERASRAAAAPRPQSRGPPRCRSRAAR